MNAEEYSALKRFPNHNMDVDDDSETILKKRLEVEGQLKWIIVNENPETGDTRVLYSVEEFELMKDLAFDEIRMKVFSLGTEEERLLYEDRNLVIAQFPTEVRDKIVNERLKRKIVDEEAELAKMREELGGGHEKPIRDKNIGNYIAPMSEPRRKAFKGLVKLVTRKANLSSPEEALIFMGRLAIKELWSNKENKQDEND